MCVSVCPGTFTSDDFTGQRKVKVKTLLLVLFAADGGWWKGECVCVYESFPVMTFWTNSGSRSQ